MKAFLISSLSLLTLTMSSSFGASMCLEVRGNGRTDAYEGIRFQIDDSGMNNIRLKMVLPLLQAELLQKNPSGEISLSMKSSGNSVVREQSFVDQMAATKTDRLPVMRLEKYSFHAITRFGTMKGVISLLENTQYKQTSKTLVINEVKSESTTIESSEGRISPLVEVPCTEVKKGRINAKDSTR